MRGSAGSSISSRRAVVPGGYACHRLRHSVPRAAAAASTDPNGPAVSDGIKQRLADELQGLNRGIFGVTAAKKKVLHGLIEELEAHNTVAEPTQQLHLVEGDWKLLYSTIVITGVKRTKLGLREFIRLGDFVQRIDTQRCLAVNRVGFAVAGLGLIQGALTINAEYRVAGPQRVDIDFKDAVLEPSQLEKLFEANYDLLLSIFNPQGHLDITYLDAAHRVGRDDKGNIFYLERAAAR